MFALYIHLLLDKRNLNTKAMCSILIIILEYTKWY